MAMQQNKKRLLYISIRWKWSNIFEEEFKTSFLLRKNITWSKVKKEKKKEKDKGV